MIFIRRHLDEALKSEYLTVEDLLAFWNALRNRYNHQITVIFPRACYEWTHLRIHDFKSVAEYNYALFRITSQMKLCGDTISEKDMLEKTFSTFHASNVLLQQQYRAQEVNDVSLEVNATSSGGDNHKRGRGHKRGRWNRKSKNHGVQFHNQEKGVETNFLDQDEPMDVPDPVCDLSGQLHTTHLDVSEFVVEKGNEVYRSD
ncbi:unnamed protein product [Malus baccata var. baccata]